MGYCWQLKILSKSFFLILILGLIPQIGSSQSLFNPDVQLNRKGDIFLSWGWNRGWYTNSDIHFKGADYNFELKNVKAYDRQSPFEPEVYFGPKMLTIPQFNFRAGFFPKKNYSVSVGTDHMKYKVKQFQYAKISGTIDTPNSGFEGVYDNDQVLLDNTFLLFEHTDGLNYLNVELRRMDGLMSLGNFNLDITEGVGVGALLPRTNSTLLGKERHDEFHLAGYGVNALLGAHLSFLRHFFVQAEFKGGFMHLPDIRTTPSPEDKASQHFMFFQMNYGIGLSFNLGKRAS